MVASQPALRDAAFVVLKDVVSEKKRKFTSAYHSCGPSSTAKILLIRGKDPCSRLRQVDLHDAQARRMSWSMTKIDTRSNFKIRSVECLPVEVKAQILGQVHANVGFGGYRVVRVLELLFVDMDRDIGAFEVLQATSMVKM
jgi:hypothetical protein